MSEPELRLRPLWIAIGWLLVAALVWVSLTPRPPETVLFTYEFGDKVGHVLAYALLMGWFVQIYHRTDTRMRFAIGLTLLGVVLEVLQWLGGVRHFEFADMGANLFGVLIGWGLALTPFDRLLSKLERHLVRER